jgi:hypothetical protein
VAVQCNKMWYELKVQAVVDSITTSDAKVRAPINVVPGAQMPAAAMLPVTPDQDRPKVWVMDQLQNVPCERAPSEAFNLASAQYEAGPDRLSTTE